MSLRRIIIIIRKDFTGGLGKTFFIMAIVVPLLFTILIELVFGKFFAEKPTLAVIDKGTSSITARIKKLDALDIEKVDSELQLKERIKSGAIDGGLIIPKDFDEKLADKKLPRVKVYVGGESLVNKRITIASSLAEVLRDEAGQKIPIKIVETSLGEAEEIPIKVKIIPLVIMYAIFIGGTTLPAALIVDEVEKRTVSAVTITPASLGELLSAKAIVGFFTSFTMGIVIIVINQLFIGNVWLLILFMALGAIFAVELGLTIGGISKDLSIAWTYVKFVGLVAFMPGILWFFPQVPEWVSKLFPTYYLIMPIIEISQRGAGLDKVGLDALILLLFDIFFIVFVLLSKRRLALRA